MMNVGQVMTTRVSWVGPDFTLPEIARRMRADDIGSLPVAHNDRLIGMVTDRDIVVRAVAEGGDIERVTARQVMSASVLYCYESDNVAAVLKNMGQPGPATAGRRSRQAPRRGGFPRGPQPGRARKSVRQRIAGDLGEAGGGARTTGPAVARGSPASPELSASSGNGPVIHSGAAQILPCARSSAG